MKNIFVGFTVIIAMLIVAVSGCGGAGTTSSAPAISTSTATSSSSATEIGPTHLVFITQPGGAKAGQAFTTQPVVAVQDGNGNIVTSALARVSLVLQTSGDAELSGTTAVVAVKGVATFTDLSINKAGAGFTLKAAAVQNASAVSAAFDVAP
jgi:hypothetical protein